LWQIGTGRWPAKNLLNLLSIARANRQRLALEEGAQAMAEIEQEAIAVRKNMERLRILREAKEAEEAKTQPAIPVSARKNRKKGLSI
jgi:hypothetical protein